MRMLVLNDSSLYETLIHKMNCISAFTIICLLLIQCSQAELAWQTPAPERENKPNLLATVWSDSLFYVAGESYIATSPDGVLWSEDDLSSLPPDRYHTIIPGDNGILILGELTTIFKQSGGQWLECRFPETSSNSSLRSALYDGLNYYGYLETSLHSSTNGLDWQEVSGSELRSTDALVFGNDIWLSLEGDTISRSTDGLSWTELDLNSVVNEAGTERYHLEMAHLEFSNERFVISMFEDTELGFNTYATSTNGIDWDLAPSPPYLSVFNSNSGGGVSIEIGSGETGEYLDIQLVHLTLEGQPIVIHSERNGVNVEQSFSDFFVTNFRSASSSSDGVTIVVGDSGLILRSTDPLVEFSWTETGLIDFIPLDGASSGNRMNIIAEGYSQYQNSFTTSFQLRTSVNGVDWENVTLPSEFDCIKPLIRFHENTWFISCHNELYTSSDGVTWSTGSPTLNGTLLDLNEFELPTIGRKSSSQDIFIGKIGGIEPLFGLFGDEQSWSRSDNGVDWITLSDDVSEALTIIFADGVFYAYFETEVFRSRDAIAWEAFPLTGTPLIESISYYKGRWTAESASSYFASEYLVSEDGTTWFPVEEPAVAGRGHVLTHTVEINDMLIGELGLTFWTSQDALYWKESRADLYDQAFAMGSVSLHLDGSLVTVGEDFYSRVSTPVQPAAALRQLRLIDPRFLEAPAEEGFEYLLQRTHTLQTEDWTNLGDWKSGGSTLFWLNHSTEEAAFFSILKRPIE